MLFWKIIDLKEYIVYYNQRDNNLVKNYHIQGIYISLLFIFEFFFYNLNFNSFINPTKECSIVTFNNIKHIFFSSGMIILQA